MQILAGSITSPPKNNTHYSTEQFWQSYPSGNHHSSGQSGANHGKEGFTALASKQQFIEPNNQLCLKPAIPVYKTSKIQFHSTTLSLSSRAATGGQTMQVQCIIPSQDQRSSTSVSIVHCLPSDNVPVCCKQGSQSFVTYKFEHFLRTFLRQMFIHYTVAASPQA